MRRHWDIPPSARRWLWTLGRAVYNLIRQTICFFALAFGSVAVYAQETLEQRMAIALELADHDFHRVFTEEAVRELFRALPPADRRDFHAFIALPEHRKAIVHAIALAAAQTFTTEELQALVAFNSSPVGQSINKKQLPYTVASIAALNREIIPLLEKFANSRK